MARFHIILHETRAYEGTVEAASREEAVKLAVKQAKDSRFRTLPAGAWSAPICSELKESAT